MLAVYYDCDVGDEGVTFLTKKVCLTPAQLPQLLSGLLPAQNVSVN